jgi:hypothetical protein
MALYGDPIWLADVLRAAGLKVIEQPGWKQRGHGDFKNITHVMWHHTAGGGPDDWRWVQNGTNGLAGPLSQLVLERDGTFRVIAAGVAWHAGVGSWPGLPTNNANWHAIGIEAVNDGRGQPWPLPQREAYRLGSAAILNKLKEPASGIVAHKEYAKIQGKIDPYGFDMDAERRLVAALMKGAAPVPVRNEINHFEVGNPWIGKRLHDGEKLCKDGKGRYAEFANAVVYWSPSSGAHAIPNGPLRDAFTARRWEQGELGYPIRKADIKLRDGGQVQSFGGGVLYVWPGISEKGALVHGVIGDRWGKEGYEKGQLGYPLADEEKTADGGKRQRFENGELVWHPSGAIKVVSK